MACAKSMTAMAYWLLQFKKGFLVGGFKHEVQHGITIDETPLQAS